jgi:hypothetical protein
MTIETTFPEKVTCPEEADDCLFASIRNDGELNLSFSDIENRIRNVTLQEDNLVLLTFQYCFSPAHLGEEVLRVKRGPATLSQDGFTFVTHRCSPGE